MEAGFFLPGDLVASRSALLEPHGVRKPCKSDDLLTVLAQRSSPCSGPTPGGQFGRIGRGRGRSSRSTATLTLRPSSFRRRTGFRQSSPSFNRGNPYNAVIKSAASSLAMRVLDPGLRMQLVNISERLGPQPPIARSGVPASGPVTTPLMAEPLRVSAIDP